MPNIVEVLQPLGFERPGDIVDYHGGDLEQLIAEGKVRRYPVETTPTEPAPKEKPANIPMPKNVPQEVIETIEKIQEPAVEGA